MKGELHFWERIYLYWKGRSDVRANVFRDWKTGQIVPANIRQSAPFKEDGGDGDVSFSISPFLETESQRYVSVRDYKLQHSIKVYACYSGNEHQIVKMMPVIKAIADLNRQIEVNEGIIEELEKIKTMQSEKYRDIITKNTRKNYAHKAKLYETEEIAYLRSAELRIEKIKERIIILKSEKTRIRKNIESQIYSLRSHRLLRIKYYYEIASRWNPNISIFPLTEENMNEIEILGCRMDFRIFNDWFEELMQ